MRIKFFLNKLYEQLIRINDSNQKVALGIGVGVFFGIIPGFGPIISLIVASLVKVNKAAALMGCLMTNTWISIVTFLAAVKLGAFLYKIEWRILWHDSRNILQDFKLSKLFDLSIAKILAPVFVGYLITAFVISLASYILSLVLLKRFRRKNEASQA